VPQSFVLDAVVRAVRRLPGYPRLSVLDLSAARCEVLRALADDGCAVRGTHYRTDDYKLIGHVREATLPIDEGVDLARCLPFEDVLFDVVILSEVIEHLDGHATVVREAGRVLKPGGHFVLSTPNVGRLHSRLHFLLTGAHKLIRRRVGWDLAPDDLYAYHVRPVDFPLFHTFLHQAGLSIERLDFTRFKLRHSPLLLLYPVIWLAAWIEFTGRGGDGDFRRGERDLRRWMLHPAMLASEQLLITARKG
jgi:SAM-dependent methyltransferase